MGDQAVRVGLLFTKESQFIEAIAKYERFFAEYHAEQSRTPVGRYYHHLTQYILHCELALEMLEKRLQMFRNGELLT